MSSGELEPTSGDSRPAQKAASTVAPLPRMVSTILQPSPSSSAASAIASSNTPPAIALYVRLGRIV